MRYLHMPFSVIRTPTNVSGVRCSRRVSIGFTLVLSILASLSWTIDAKAEDAGDFFRG